MFRQSVNMPKYENMFAQLYGQQLREPNTQDDSALIAMSLLLTKRTEDEIWFRMHRGTSRQFNDENPGVIIAHPMTQGGKDIRQTYIEYAPEGFRRLPEFGAFYEQRCKKIIEVFINEETKQALLLTPDSSLEYIHFAIGILSKIMPWYFKDHPLDSDEKALLLGACTSAEAFAAAAEVLISKMNLRNLLLEKQLTDVQRRLNRTRVSNVESQIENLMNANRNFQEQINENLKELRNLNALLFGWQVLGEQPTDDDELLQLFRSNKNLNLQNAEDDHIQFSVDGYLDMYDPEAAERILNNPNNSLLRSRFGDEDFRSKMVRVLNAVFGEEPVLRMKTCGVFLIYFDSHVEAVSMGSWGGSSEAYTKGRMPNPHLAHFACLGQNREDINEAIRKGDIVSAVLQCVAATRRVNLLESPTLNNLLNDFKDMINDPILETMDGKSLSIYDAAELLEKGELK